MRHQILERASISRQCLSRSSSTDSLKGRLPNLVDVVHTIWHPNVSSSCALHSLTKLATSVRDKLRQVSIGSLKPAMSGEIKWDTVKESRSPVGTSRIYFVISWSPRRLIDGSSSMNCCKYLFNFCSCLGCCAITGLTDYLTFVCLWQPPGEFLELYVVQPQRIDRPEPENGL
mmetsp:Transcript_29708/g.88814  ORF Transcript_29708/g.88814 Transcript_29708/m.88814 type:complete len:173 (+) Transcript_29708:2851-3369(+)